MVRKEWTASQDCEQTVSYFHRSICSEKEIRWERLDELIGSKERKGRRDSGRI